MECRYEGLSCGRSGLTFRSVNDHCARHGKARIIIPPAEDGGDSNLSLLLSDQCPWGITILGPGGSSRVTGSVITHAPRALEVLDGMNPRAMLEGSKVPVSRFPRMAVTESVMNAVLYRDYSSDEDITVMVNDDSMEIVSPGALTWMPSERRNPSLIEVMAAYGAVLGDRSGMTTIRRCYLRTTVDPHGRSSDGRFHLILPAVTQILEQHEARKQMLIRYMSRRGGVTLSEIARLLMVSKTHSDKVIGRLEEEGVVFHMHRGVNRRFFLCKRP